MCVITVTTMFLLGSISRSQQKYIAQLFWHLFIIFSNLSPTQKGTYLICVLHACLHACAYTHIHTRARTQLPCFLSEPLHCALSPPPRAWQRRLAGLRPAADSDSARIQAWHNECLSKRGGIYPDSQTATLEPAVIWNWERRQSINKIVQKRKSAKVLRRR